MASTKSSAAQDLAFWCVGGSVLSLSLNMARAQLRVAPRQAGAARSRRKGGGSGTGTPAETDSGASDEEGGAKGRRWRSRQRVSSREVNVSAHFASLCSCILLEGYFLRRSPWSPRLSGVFAHGSGTALEVIAWDRDVGSPWSHRLPGVSAHGSGSGSQTYSLDC